MRPFISVFRLWMLSGALQKYGPYVVQQPIELFYCELVKEKPVNL